MLNLTLHCGGERVYRAQVVRCPTPGPTETWQPIPHHALLERVESTLAASGLNVTNQAHALWGKGLRYFGLLEVANGHHHADYSLVVGVRNSHDKSFPAGLALGAGVFVCDNLSFSSTVVIARRHTRFIERDLPQVVQTAVARLVDLRAGQDCRIEAYKTTELGDQQVHDLVVRALDAQVMPVTRLPEVIEEWRTPRHPEFTSVGKTAWRLFNAFTEHLKGNLTMLPRRTQALHGLLDGACGLPAMSAN